MFCPNCGTEIKEKKTFCPKCGSPLGVEAVQEDTKTVEAAASTENVHENVIPPPDVPIITAIKISTTATMPPMINFFLPPFFDGTGAPCGGITFS